ncbi:MAG: NADH-quinone oxidoreductase subunit H [Spirochaetes bacterium]|nr:NADH-quinone oxidoreductase subunit H [Spirochaetota bacterium]HOD13200.1 NADH-quinone oxidoreductase subunit H [Spirochaetota bacterium]HPG48993.1 NADH-quinone oxidoreductase subunit H [Spirochaetota bacterium]
MMEIIINIALLFILPFLFLGLINRVKSIWAGRRGPSIIQPFRDFMRLMKKGEVISTTASFVFRIAPSVNFAAVIAAGLIVPMAGGKSIISFEADFILFAYLLAAGKFLTVAGAMDTGSAFEGMGASREVTFSALVEPAFFVIIASLSLISGGLSFDKIFSVAHNASVAYLVLPLGVIALFIMLLTEGCRVPVDDPNTHLELTMIHEVMVLDNSGPDMGFIVYAAAMKMVVIGSIIANLIIPEGLPLWASAGLFIAVEAALAVIIGTIESVMARLRMTHVPQFLLFMTAISVVIVSTVVLFISGGIK